jgi:hypothetical protein
MIVPKGSRHRRFRVIEKRRLRPFRVRRSRRRRLTEEGLRLLSLNRAPRLRGDPFLRRHLPPLTYQSPLLLPIARSLGCIPAPVVRVPGVPEPPRSPALGVCSIPLRVGSAISPGLPLVDAPGVLVVAFPLDVPVVVPVCAIAIDDVARMPSVATAIILFIGVLLFSIDAN